jgi:hypothetical protein
MGAEAAAAAATRGAEAAAGVMGVAAIRAAALVAAAVGSAEATPVTGLCSAGLWMGGAAPASPHSRKHFEHMSFVAERPKNPHPLAQGIDFSADKGSILGTNARVMRKRRQSANSYILTLFLIRPPCVAAERRPN